MKLLTLLNWISLILITLLIDQMSYYPYQVNPEAYLQWSFLTSPQLVLTLFFSLPFFQLALLMSIHIICYKILGQEHKFSASTKSDAQSWVKYRYIIIYFRTSSNFIRTSLNAKQSSVICQKIQTLFVCFRSHAFFTTLYSM